MFVDGDPFAVDPEDLEEGVPEGLGLALFVVCIGPVTGKSGSARAIRLVSTSCHGCGTGSGVWEVAGAEGFEPSTYGFGVRGVSLKWLINFSNWGNFGPNRINGLWAESQLSGATNHTLERAS